MNLKEFLKNGKQVCVFNKDGQKINGFVEYYKRNDKTNQIEPAVPNVVKNASKNDNKVVKIYDHPKKKPSVTGDDSIIGDGSDEAVIEISHPLDEERIIDLKIDGGKSESIVVGSGKTVTKTITSSKNVGENIVVSVRGRWELSEQDVHIIQVE